MADPDNTFWVNYNGMKRHVEVGSAVHERLAQEGVAGVPPFPGDTTEVGNVGDYDDLTAKELRVLAEERGVDVPGKAKKDEIVDALIASESTVLEETVEEIESEEEEEE